MGLIYVNEEASSLINALNANSSSSNEMLSQLQANASRLANMVETNGVSGAAYTAASGLFADILNPLITLTKNVVENVESDTRQFQAAYGIVADESYLDEAALNSELMALHNLKQIADYGVERLRALSSGSGYGGASCFEMRSAIDNLQYQSNCLEEEIIQTRNKLQKLFDFASSVDGLFTQSMSDLQLLQGKIWRLRDVSVHADGTYTLPPGLDKSWFTNLERTRFDVTAEYDRVVNEILKFDDSGKICDYNETALFKYAALMAEGKLSASEREALQTVLYSMVGGFIHINGLEDEVNGLMIAAAGLQDCLDPDHPFFGFRYNAEQKRFYTTQDSIQSLFGFLDFYDACGWALGMDLDTEKVQFYHEGKEYRFQVWKGTYGMGSLAGGEQGWYVSDPDTLSKDPANYTADTVGLGDYVPASQGDDRIRMVNTFYNKRTGGKIMEPSDSNSFRCGPVYWNLVSSVYGAGYVRGDLYTKGKLYIPDDSLRNKLYQEMKANDGFSEVAIDGEKVSYTWSN